jgi:hypothetical protein
MNEITLHISGGSSTPDDGWMNRLKHVEQFIEINR